MRVVSKGKKDQPKDRPFPPKQLGQLITYRNLRKTRCPAQDPPRSRYCL